MKELCSLVRSSLVSASLSIICTLKCYVKAQLLYLHVQVGLLYI